MSEIELIDNSDDREIRASLTSEHIQLPVDPVDDSGDEE